VLLLLQSDSEGGGGGNENNSESDSSEFNYGSETNQSCHSPDRAGSSATGGSQPAMSTLLILIGLGALGLGVINQQTTRSGGERSPQQTPAVSANTQQQSSKRSIETDQRSIQDARAVPSPLSTTLVLDGTNGQTFEMVFMAVPTGVFTTGCSESDTYCEADQLPRHLIEISRPYEIGKVEVTHKQWISIMGKLPAGAREHDPDVPLDQVSWFEAQEFLSALNLRDREFHYRLPSEAEWEYAARATTTKKTYGELEEVAWAGGNVLRPVGLKAPNLWGIHDITSVRLTEHHRLVSTMAAIG